MINEVLKGQLLIRAGYRCEYCRALLTDVQFEVEHVWPESRGGQSDLCNLAVACQRCNRNKGDHVDWVDRISGINFPLFNPRTMKWEEHFIISHREIIGNSPIGRATASLLFRSTSQYLPPDLRWNKITELGENKPLYNFLNHLRYRRLRNDFSGLFKQLAVDIPTIEVTQRQSRIAYFAKQLLLLELYFTRSRQKDIENGFARARSLLSIPTLSPSQRSDILNALSVLYQQRATIAFEHGDRGSAIADQRTAYDYHAAAHPHVGNAWPFTVDWRLDPEHLSNSLKATTLESKYHQFSPQHNIIDAYIAHIPDLDPFYCAPYYSYLIDLVLLDPSPSLRQLENLYGITANMLINEGYGTRHDYARLVSVRRRWWVLHLIIESSPDWETMVSDIEFWNDLSMFNEVREFKGHLMRVEPLVPPSSFNDVIEVCRHECASS